MFHSGCIKEIGEERASQVSSIKNPLRPPPLEKAPNQIFRDPLSPSLLAT
jgi:hypothetical protein